MNTNTNKRLNKKVIYSLLLIVVIAASASIGTYAYFTATRTTTANRFVAGTLDLNVSSNGSVLEPFVITNMGENGTIGGEKTWEVKNTGSLPGRFYIRLQNVNNTDNGCNDQEKMAEPTCEADNAGELGNVVNLKVLVDGSEKASSTLATANMANVGTQWSALSPIIVQPGQTILVKTIWSADENAYSNEIQSDEVLFDMNLRLIQNISGPQPAN